MYILLQRKALWSEKKYSCDSRGTLNVKRHIGSKSFSEIAFSPPKEGGGPLGPLHWIFVPKGVVAKKTFSFLFLSLRVSGSETSPPSPRVQVNCCLFAFGFFRQYSKSSFCLVTVMCCYTLHCWPPLMKQMLHYKLKIHKSTAHLFNGNKASDEGLV